MKLTTLQLLLLALFVSTALNFYLFFQQDKMLLKNKMTFQEATVVVAAHDICMKNAHNGFCYMTFENFVFYYEAIAVVEKDKRHDIE